MVDGITYVPKEKPKFKVGDVVRFKNKDSKNARFFDYGLTNLTIKWVRYDSSYEVYESDRSCWWSVDEEELELQPVKRGYLLMDVGTWQEYKRNIRGAFVCNYPSSISDNIQIYRTDIGLYYIYKDVE